MAQAANTVCLSRGIFFHQKWVSPRKVMPVVSDGIHRGQMHLLVGYLGIEAVFQFGSGIIGHSQGIAAGATDNRVALESVLWARSDGVDLFADGASVIARAAKKCKPLIPAPGL